MSSSAIAQVANLSIARAPRAPLLWAIALFGCAAGASSLAFALTNDAIGDELGEPLVIASLWSWTTSPTSWADCWPGRDDPTAGSARS